MEDGQNERISKTFQHLKLPQIEVLHIEDEYLDAGLKVIIKDKIN